MTPLSQTRTKVPLVLKYTEYHQTLVETFWRVFPVKMGLVHNSSGPRLLFISNKIIHLEHPHPVVLTLTL